MSKLPMAAVSGAKITGTQKLQALKKKAKPVNNLNKQAPKGYVSKQYKGANFVKEN